MLKPSDNRERPQVVDEISRYVDDVCDVADQGYRRYGRGAVLLSELPVPLARSRPVYLPASEADFQDAPPKLRSAVEVYDPEVECVLVLANERMICVVFISFGAGGPTRRTKPTVH